MRGMQKFLFLLFLLLVSSVPALATDFWVAPAPLGSNSNAGTATAPFLTIQHPDNAAVSGFAAGSTVHVAPGTYPGQFSVTAPGTLASPINYVCDVKWSCVITASTADSGTIGVAIGSTGTDWSVSAVTTNSANCSGATPCIEITTTGANTLFTGQCGVEVAGVTVAGNANGVWCVTVIDTTHFTLNNSVFKATEGVAGTVRSGNAGAYTNFSGFEINGTWTGTGTEWFVGLYMTGTGDTAHDNKIHDVSFPPGSNNGSTGGACVNMDGYYGGSNQSLYNNLVYRCGPQGQKQTLIHGIYVESYGTTIYNNIIYQVSGECIAGWHGDSHVLITNNTMFYCLDFGISVGGGDYIAPFIKTGTPASSGISALNSTNELVVGMGVEDVTTPSCLGNGDYTNQTIASITNSTTIVLSAPVGTGCGTGDTLHFGGPATGMQIRNTIAYGANSGDTGIGEFGNDAANTYSNNDTYNFATNTGSFCSGCTPTAGITTNPNFVNYQQDGSGDYHLLQTSGAITAGTTTNLPAADYDGRARPLGSSPSMGAYEYDPNCSPIVSKWNWLAQGASNAFHAILYGAPPPTWTNYPCTRVADVDGAGNETLLGGLVVGTPTGGNPGAGSINAQGFYLNGTQINIEPVQSLLKNGFMDWDQINEGATYTIGQAASVVNTLDGWDALASTSVTGTSTVQRVSTSPPPGGSYWLTYTVGTGAAITAAQYITVYQPIPASDITTLQFGTAGAQQVCASWYAKSSVANAIFGGALQNAAKTRSYPFAFQGGAANTAKQFIICVPGDTAGTWVTSGNAAGMLLTFAVSAGATEQTTAAQPYATAAPAGTAVTLGAWQTTTTPGIFADSAITNIGATTGATFSVGAAQLIPSASHAPIFKRSAAQELALVEREYAKTFAQGTAPGNNVSKVGALCAKSATTTPADFGVQWQFPVTMLSAPAITTYNPGSSTAGNWCTGTSCTDSFTVSVDPATAKSPNGVFIAEATSTPVAAATYCIQATANARL